MIEFEVDLEKYLLKLKNQGFDVKKIENYLDKLISSNVLEQRREVQ